ncbi:MAG: hypothetical protein ACI86H_001936 [bacterium]|jgi:hypothetical protein
MAILQNTHILFFNRDMDLNFRVKKILKHLGLKVLHDVSDFREVELILEIRSFNYIFYKLPITSTPDSQKEIEFITNYCKIYKVPLTVFANQEFTFEEGLQFPTMFLPVTETNKILLEKIRAFLHIENENEVESTKNNGISEKIKTLLCRLKFFKSFSEITLDSVIRLGKLLEFPEGKIVFKENTHGSHFCIIISGMLHVNFEEQKVAELTVGDCFGEMSLIQPKEPRHVNISTASIARVFILPHGFLSEISSDSKVEIYQSITMALVEKLKKTTTQLNQTDITA